jgi:hypothetical protein
MFNTDDYKLHIPLRKESYEKEKIFGFDMKHLGDVINIKRMSPMVTEAPDHGGNELIKKGEILDEHRWTRCIAKLIRREKVNAEKNIVMLREYIDQLEEELKKVQGASVTLIKPDNWGIYSDWACINAMKINNDFLELQTLVEKEIRDIKFKGFQKFSTRVTFDLSFKCLVVEINGFGDLGQTKFKENRRFDSAGNKGTVIVQILSLFEYWKRDLIRTHSAHIKVEAPPVIIKTKKSKPTIKQPDLFL